MADKQWFYDVADGVSLPSGITDADAKEFIKKLHDFYSQMFPEKELTLESGNIIKGISALDAEALFLVATDGSTHANPTDARQYFEKAREEISNESLFHAEGKGLVPPKAYINEDKIISTVGYTAQQSLELRVIEFADWLNDPANQPKGREGEFKTQAKDIKVINVGGRLFIEGMTPEQANFIDNALNGTQKQPEIMPKVPAKQGNKTPERVENIPTVEEQKNAAKKQMMQDIKSCCADKLKEKLTPIEQDIERLKGGIENLKGTAQTMAAKSDPMVKHANALRRAQEKFDNSHGLCRILAESRRRGRIERANDALMKDRKNEGTADFHTGEIKFIEAKIDALAQKNQEASDARDLQNKEKMKTIETALNALDLTQPNGEIIKGIQKALQEQKIDIRYTEAQKIVKDYVANAAAPQVSQGR